MTHHLDRIRRYFTDLGPEPCWPWQGYITANGYGSIAIYGGGGKTRTYRAHRAVYELLVGPIPEHRDIDHRCRNRACVNPAHLEAVTHSENMKRSPLVGGARWRLVLTYVAPVATHGTLATYSNHRCRCEPCRAAMREYNAAYQARRRDDRPNRAIDRAAS